MLLATKLTIISNLCSSKGIKVMKNRTFFQKLCKDEGITGKSLTPKKIIPQLISSQTAISIPR